MGNIVIEWGFGGIIVGFGGFNFVTKLEFAVKIQDLRDKKTILMSW